jgi:YidC/Oxa1 family membrane protein insertase
MLLRKVMMTFTILIILALLAGCSADPNNPQPVNPEGGIWDRFFVWPLSVLLDYSASWFGYNYGVAIFIATLVIRLITLPLMIKQLKSSKKMQELQPELQKIREKYKDNQQKMQEETMKLFQKNNVNPLAGCLPLLVQMPILIAFYHAIIRNESVRTHDFLWMSLGSPDPYYILPILAAVTTYMQQKIMGQNPAATPQMNQQMQIMLIVMPIMILVIAVTLPSALSLYWVYSNIFTIVQSYFMYKDRRTPVKEGGRK